MGHMWPMVGQGLARTEELGLVWLEWAWSGPPQGSSLVPAGLTPHVGLASNLGLGALPPGTRASSLCP